MKLLIATGLYPPDMGGPATYSVFLEKHLPLHGVDFVVVSFGTVRKYPKLIRHLAYTFLLIRQGRSADIIYALDTVSVGVPAMIASCILRSPLFLRVPGDYAWEQGQQRFGITETLDEYLVSKKRPYKVRLLAWIQYRVAKWATRIIAPSEYIKRVVTMWGIDPIKITRVYSELKVIDVPESRESLRAQFGYDGFIIVTAARLVPWKGVRVLVDVVATLHREGLPVSLEIIGDGTSRRELEEYVVEMGLTSHVHFHGTLSREVLGKHIKASDAFVLNTSYEGLSHQLLEVMHIGTPIITTPVGGNTELIIDRKEGLLVPFNDSEAFVQALKELMHNETLRGLLSLEAQKKVALFHEDRVVTEFVALLK